MVGGGGGERVATCRDYGWGVGGEEANINNWAWLDKEKESQRQINQNQSMFVF